MGRLTWRGAAAGVGAAVLGVALAGCAEDVGTPPGLGSARALAVNEHGVALVQAWADGPGLPPDGWSAWTLAPDGAWAPVSPPGVEPDHRVAPAAINAGGTVVGTSEDPEVGSSSTTAFAWHPVDGSRVLEPLPGGGVADVADVDEGGTVVGASSGDGIRAVRWEPGATEPIELATPAGWSYARAVAVNDSGTIVGTAEDTGQYSGAAVVWEPPGYAPRLLPGRGPTYATDIDDDGTVVGYSAFRDEAPVGLRWSPAGDMAELGDFVPVAVDDGTMVSGSGGLWPAGADAPEYVGNTPGRRTVVTDIAGGYMVGSLAGEDDVHAARFTPNP